MKTEPCRIIMIGMSGVGKSYYGHVIADVLKIPFFDTDILLENQYMESIDKIIKEYGESNFRDFEERIFRDCLLNDDMVLSTGGGIVEREINRNLLSMEKKVIYLKASSLTLAKRLAVDDNLRPLLNYENLEESVFSLLKHREKWYFKCSDIVIDTDFFDAEKILAQIFDVI